MPRYAEVLLDVANRRLDRSYHYLIPDHLAVKPGMTVLVGLRHRKVQGLVAAVTEDCPELDEGVSLREIEAVLEQSLLPSELVDLAAYLAETTICSVAQALHTVWPFLKGKVESWILPLADMDDEDVKALELLDPDIYRALKALHRSPKKALAESILLKRADIDKSLLEEMIQRGWVKKETRYSGAGRLKKKGAGKTELKNEHPQKDEHQQPETLEAKDAADGDRLMRKVALSPAQEEAAAKIWEAYQAKDGSCILLHGITGSGKTEVYREIVARVLQEGGDAILLVPEISLTSQLSRIFLQSFGDLVGVVHSGISPGEKIALWEEILAGKKRIVIGARSAVFAPLPNLSLIIVDEEHESAYKQDENPKYHAREVARYRMSQRKGTVVLGSATPSLEAYAAAQRGKVGLVYLGERYMQRALPQVQIVDMKAELARGNRSMFSYLLRSKLRERIKKGEQTILFLNRRGYSTFVFCRECGFVARCPQCDISLTYHSPNQELRCHYCDYKQEIFHRCPECSSRYIRFFGQGTQKVEEEVSAMFPGIEVLRLDTDTTGDLAKHGEIIERFRSQNVPILVGTQMLAKGLDFPNVTLVGVISADGLLNMPDFRSRERTFQLLTQVAGRAGRGAKQGEVVIQTYSPEDRAVLRAAKQDYAAFFWEEIAYRKQLGYPPFSHLIRVLLFHENEQKVIQAAQDLADCIRISLPAENHDGMQILGPAPAVLSKLKNEFRWQLSLKGKDPDALRKIVHTGVKLFFQRSASSGMRISIEVNPLN